MTSADAALRVFVYDEDGRDLSTSLRQLLNHGLKDDEVILFSSRLDLLAGVAKAEGPIVVLVDLQADNRRDQNYSGHRIIETIRRHRDLARHGRPVAHTVHARPDVIKLAARHGALGLISKTDLDVPDDEVAEVGLIKYIQTLRDVTPSASAPAFSTFPTTQRAAQRYARTAATVQQGLNQVLIPWATTPEPSRIFFWDLIGYLAEGLEPTSAAHWIAADNPSITPRQVTKSLERLKPLVAPEYRAGSRVDWANFARDLLELVPQLRTPPTITRALRTLVRVHEIEDLLTERRLRMRGFLDAQAAEALDRVLTADAVPRHIGNEGRWNHTDDLRATIAAIEPDPDQQAALTAAFVRGVNNIYATYLEERQRARLERNDP